MGVSMLIRDMKPEDLDRIVEIEKSLQLHPWPKAAFEQAMRLKQFCIVVEDNTGIAGYGVGFKGHGRTIGALNTQAAGALYRAWADDARHSRAPFMTAETEADNHAANARLRRFGFEVIGERPNFYGVGKPALCWQKCTEENTVSPENESA